MHHITKVNPQPAQPTGAMVSPDASDAAALGSQFEELYGVERVELNPEGAFALVLPKGKGVVSVKPLLDELRALPDRRRGTATAADLVSFIALVTRFRSPDTAIFASPERSAPSFLAVFDYHPTGPNATVADWLKHRAVYRPQLSNEWQAWIGADGKEMAQDDFARFIEDRITEVIVPNLEDERLLNFAKLVQGKFAEPSELVALSRGLQVNVQSQVKQATTLQTGEIKVLYEETHHDGAGQPISIPSLFQICIPVFYAGAPYRIPARLRYRVHQGRILWRYQLVRTDLVFDDAVTGMVEQVRDETGVPVYLGTPEA